MRDRAPPRPGVQIDAPEPKSWRDQAGARYIRAGDRAIRHLLRIEGLAVEDQFGVEFSRTPAVEHRPHSVLADAQEAGERAQIGGKRDNSPDVQIAIGPAVEPVSNTTRAGVRVDGTGAERGTGVVDRRMTKRALQAYRLER